MRTYSKFATRGFTVLALLFTAAPLAFTTNSPKLLKTGTVRFLIQTTVTDPRELSNLSRWLEKNRFDVAGIKAHQGQVEVITSQEGINFLKLQGLNGKVIPNKEGALDPRYLNASNILPRLEAIHQKYPKLTSLVKIGTSLQGRPISALLLSTTPNMNDPEYLAKPSIIFDGVHHAREIMTAEVVTDVADTVLSAAADKKNLAAQGLLSRWNIWLVPIINMDGSNIVFTQDNMWRKNARADQSDIFGVDINRNYPYRWADCNGSAGSPSDETYHGASAASEPETAAMVNLGNAVRPTASLSYHSYSEFVLYPYGCHGDFPGEKDLIVKIGKELADRLPSDDNAGKYTPGTPWELLYDVDGSSMDFFYASFGTLSYTFEINREFQPDYSLRLPTVEKERNAWGYFLKRIDQNLLHVIVVDAKKGKPAPSFIAINTIKHIKGELAYRTNAAGHYFKVLDPGQYTIAAKLSDGREGQMTVQMNGKPQTITLNVE